MTSFRDFFTIRRIVWRLLQRIVSSLNKSKLIVSNSRCHYISYAAHTKIAFNFAFVVDVEIKFYLLLFQSIVPPRTWKKKFWVLRRVTTLSAKDALLVARKTSFPSINSVFIPLNYSAK